MMQQFRREEREVISHRGTIDTYRQIQEAVPECSHWSTRTREHELRPDPLAPSRGEIITLQVRSRRSKISSGFFKQYIYILWTYIKKI